MRVLAKAGASYSVELCGKTLGECVLNATESFGLLIERTMSEVIGYMLTYSDDVYEGPSILPGVDVMPRVLYRTIGEAEEALELWKKKIDNFMPVLYGQVYPYENTTAREQIQKKGYAVYGWTSDVSDSLFVMVSLFYR